MGNEMGTNYYHRFNSCECCGRHEDRHIGKSFTMFQGYRRPEWLDEDDLFDQITSWAQWRDRLRAGGEVWDEYGRQWDVEEFIAAVESTDRAERCRQFEWVAAHSKVDPLETWLDEDGFSFDVRDFS